MDDLDGQVALILADRDAVAAIGRAAWGAVDFTAVLPSLRSIMPSTADDVLERAVSRIIDAREHAGHSLGLANIELGDLGAAGNAARLGAIGLLALEFGGRMVGRVDVSAPLLALVPDGPDPASDEQVATAFALVASPERRDEIGNLADLDGGERELLRMALTVAVLERHADLVAAPALGFLAEPAGSSTRHDEELVATAAAVRSLGELERELERLRDAHRETVRQGEHQQLELARLRPELAVAERALASNRETLKNRTRALGAKETEARRLSEQLAAAAAAASPSRTLPAQSNKCAALAIELQNATKKLRAAEARLERARGEIETLRPLAAESPERPAAARQRRPQPPHQGQPLQPSLIEQPAARPPHQDCATQTLVAVTAVTRHKGVQCKPPRTANASAPPVAANPYASRVDDDFPPLPSSRAPGARAAAAAALPSTPTSRSGAALSAGPTARASADAALSAGPTARASADAVLVLSPHLAEPPPSPGGLSRRLFEGQPAQGPLVSRLDATVWYEAARTLELTLDHLDGTCKLVAPSVLSSSRYGRLTKLEVAPGPNERASSMTFYYEPCACIWRLRVHECGDDQAVGPELSSVKEACLKLRCWPTSGGYTLI